MPEKPTIDPVCIVHGKKMSEHDCLYCCLCFKTLTPEECAKTAEGIKEDVCEECSLKEAAAVTAIRSSNAKFVDQKMIEDPAYAPYCLRPGCLRMVRVSPTRAECRCGTYHQIPQESGNG